MKKVLRVLVLAGLLSVITATAAFAAGDNPEGFVCPVLGGQAGEEQGNSSPDVIITIADNDKSIVGPDVAVPAHATNDEGAGAPDGPHDSPGDDGYTAIWKK